LLSYIEKENSIILAVTAANEGQVISCQISSHLFNIISSNIYRLEQFRWTDVSGKS
jgi:hypothetical protein